MKQRIQQRATLTLTLLIVLVVVGLFSIAPFALGSPAQSPVQQDETAIAETVNALVNQRFQETLDAMNVMMTATALASGDTTLTQTASFDATVNAVFNNAMTATAQGAVPVQVTEVPAQAASPLPVEGTPTPAGFQIRLEPRGEDVDEDDWGDTADVIEDRLEAMGLTVDVDARGNDAIIILMPFMDDADLDPVLAAIQQTGLLEFVDFSGMLDQVNAFVEQDIQTTAGEDREREDDEALANPLTNEPFETVLTGDDVEDAHAEPSPDGSTWSVVFDFSDDGGERMTEFTGNHIGEPLAIAIDGHVISIPVIQGEFGSTGGQLAGNFSQEEAERLAVQLNFGALPLDVVVERVNTVDELPERLAQAIPTAGPSPTPTLTPTIDPRPADTVGEIFVAEEVFEHGRMFYVQPVAQIWVMIEEGDERGTWRVYQDTFTDGEPEVDPSLVPPEGMYQPERGFGKLWRENEEVRDALGWAVTPEFGYNSEYRYHPGGELVNGQWVPGPGYHVLFSLDGDAFQFNEADNTWELHDDD